MTRTSKHAQQAPESRARSRYTLRRVLLALGSLAVLLVLLGTNPALAWYDAHLALVSGREGIPRVLCTYCHGWGEAPPMGLATGAARYVNPVALAVAPDGRRLYVAASTQGRLLEVDLDGGETVRSVEVGAGPRDIAVAPDGQRLAVSCRADDLICIVDAATLAVVDTLPVGAEPTGLVYDRDSTRLFVANSGDDSVESRPLDPGSRPSYLAAGEEPMALALALDGTLLCAVNRNVRMRPQEEILGSEVTLIDAASERVRRRHVLTSAHLGQDIVLSSDGSFALAPVIHFRNHLPITQVARGAVMTCALAFVATGDDGRAVQFPLDDVNACFADPTAVALTPDDRLAFVAHGGANLVSVIDVGVLRRLYEESEADVAAAFPEDLALSARYVLGRIRTRDVPASLAVAPDGTRLYVAERLSDSVAVIDVATLQVIGHIELGEQPEPTAERRGERVFHDASVTFQGQFSCRSCHPEGHTDSIIWDFEIDGVGENLLETRSLRGIRDTPPFKWNGKNPDLQTQCGPRFAKVLMRSEPIAARDLDDLVAFIESIPLRSRRSPRGSAEERERGRQIFFRKRDNNGAKIPRSHRCATCHRPPLFTDRLMADVGTGGSFDTPHLFDVASSAPYLHDGRALTLEEVWTVHSPEDTHGRTNDLSKIELNELVTFLRSL